jgi:hypothetical protein
VLPPDGDLLPSEEEQGEFFVRQALRDMGCHSAVQLYLSVAPGQWWSSLGRILRQGNRLAKVEGMKSRHIMHCGGVGCRREEAPQESPAHPLPL